MVSLTITFLSPSSSVLSVKNVLRNGIAKAGLSQQYFEKMDADINVESRC